MQSQCLVLYLNFLKLLLKIAFAIKYCIESFFGSVFVLNVRLIGTDPIETAFIIFWFVHPSNCQTILEFLIKHLIDF